MISSANTRARVHRVQYSAHVKSKFRVARTLPFFFICVWAPFNVNCRAMSGRNPKDPIPHFYLGLVRSDAPAAVADVFLSLLCSGFQSCRGLPSLISTINSLPLSSQETGWVRVCVYASFYFSRVFIRTPSQSLNCSSHLAASDDCLPSIFGT